MLHSIIHPLEPRLLLAATLSIKDAWVIEGDNSSLKPYMSFFAKLGQASSNPVTFHYQTFDGTAKAGIDYVASSGDVTFALNETNKEILIPTFADTTPEANKAFKLVLTGVTNAIPARSEIPGTIFDNDGQSETRVGQLTPTFATNGWGPYEVNRSNGETGANDGRPITFPGGVMPYGLGVHADSDLRYNLAGKYSRFSASIGVDAEVGSAGSVVFEVKLDGVTVYESEIMRGQLAPEMIATDVTGKNTLDLVVTDAGDGKAYDHADWGNASLFAPIADTQKPVLTIKDGWTVEGDNASLKPYLSFFATLSAASSTPVTFHYQTADGTGLAGVDYVATSGDITFAANETKKEILIPTFADTTPEANKTFKLLIASVTNAIPARSEITGTIFDNDGQSETRMGTLTPTHATNGWGPYEVNRSNGETGANDGHPISLAGGVMPYGLGVHANSDLRYNLAGKYSRFSATVGVDGEVGAAGSVVFKVLLDGVTVYDSGIMRGQQTPEMIAIDCAGKNTLDLIVTDAGDGNNSDHADWGNASLFGTAPAPPTATYLSDLAPVSAINGWGAYERDRSNGERGATDGRLITLNGTSYMKGLGTHARSELVFDIPAGAQRFQSDIGIDDEIVQVGSVIFKVYSGSDLLFSSTKITGSSAIQSVDVNVFQRTQLKLVVEDAGDGVAYDHADWAMARFVK